MEVSVLRRCSSYIDVRLMEASVLRRCSSYRGVRFTEVSIKRELTVSVKKIYTMFYEISKRKVALIQELPSLLRPQPVCGGSRGRISQATESSTGIPKRYGKRAEVDGKKERLSGGLFLSLFPSDWPQFLVAQRGLCRGYRPKMKVSLLQHAYARYLSQESRFTNYPLWRPFSKSFQKRRGRRAKAEEKGAFLHLCGVSVHRVLAKTVCA